jgi:peptidoglycan/LPS O-acetylase OafA/YrhL
VTEFPISGASDTTAAVVRILIAVLCAAAFLLIVVILSGERLDDTSGKAIATALGFALFSLTAVAGTGLRESPPPLNLFGYVVAMLSVAAFLSGAIAIWSEPGGDGWELPGILFVLAAGSGHAALLLKGAREDDNESVRAIRGAVLVLIATLCLMATMEISSDGGDIDPRAFGVLAVLYLLGTLLLPLARHGSSPAPSAPAPQGPPPASAAELLRANGHVVVEGPLTRGGIHGGGENVCLREPDGTLVELITYDDA